MSYKTLNNQIDNMQQYRLNAEHLSEHLKLNKAVEVQCGNVKVQIPSYALQPLIDQLIEALNDDIHLSKQKKLTLN
ncbi:hypothetical protein [Vibrio phage vB_VibM_83AMN]|nr:hypothetical protein [Vibrio phage vB_VibM_83AMN]